MSFRFIVPGVPVSVQAKKAESKENWKKTVRAAALKGKPAGWELEKVDKCIVNICYFFRDGGVDLDNIIKPILDAMIDVAYSDDRKITAIVLRAIDLDYVILKNDAKSWLTKTVETKMDFTVIEIAYAPNKEIYPWHLKAN
ncbi:MAG: RusA family crossover junction endodeoxyribonuclease [Tagaea sp.]|nr:RusA family crossover junction endodeoxyribonuclease [Tagaea sp.]